VLTHAHPDHVVDVYGLHVMLRYALGRSGLPIYAPAGLGDHLGILVGGDWGGAFSWHAIDDDTEVSVGSLALRFSRTDHPPPTYAVQVAANGSRLVYTSDTGPRWSVEAFPGGADLVLSAGARRLMLTHVWPRVDRRDAAAEGSAAYGEPVMLAEPGQTTTI